MTLTDGATTIMNGEVIDAGASKTSDPATDPNAKTKYCIEDAGAGSDDQSLVIPTLCGEGKPKQAMPTLAEWGLALLAIALVVGGFVVLRRHGKLSAGLAPA